MALTADKSIGKMVVENPARARVFEEFGIDYCCRGKQTLAEACRDKGLSAETVLLSLNQAEASEEPAIDLTRLTISELVTHIVEVHHEYVKDALPRIDRLIEKVVNAHGDRRPELHELKATFQKMSKELEQHTIKEEAILFPACLQLDAADELPAQWFTVFAPIQQMLVEHDSAGEDLRRIRKLTSDFTPPTGACATYQVLFDSLQEFEGDLHLHIHKENNVLFPRVVELEKEKSKAVY